MNKRFFKKTYSYVAVLEVMLTAIEQRVKIPFIHFMINITIYILGVSALRGRKTIFFLILTVFRMDFFGAAHGWGGGQKGPPP